MLIASRPFRFGVQMRNATTPEQWLERARRAENLGYSVLTMPDHFGDQFSSVPALTAAAVATSTLRVGTYVLSNDFRHPVELAKEAATLDFLSGGRFELGIGAGWMEQEYRQSGLVYDAAPTRLGRLEESVYILKHLFRAEPLTLQGTYYSLTDMVGFPRPSQSSGPPILIGGGGRRILSIAAREADIVGLAPRVGLDSKLDVRSLTGEATSEKVGWIRAAAGERLNSIELNIYVYWVVLTSTPKNGRKEAIKNLASSDPELSEDFLANTPHALVGTVDEIVEQLQSRRSEYGISYITVQEQHMESLAPIVSVIRGK